MKKLELKVTAICWVVWMMIYVLLAAWVFEGHWEKTGIRAISAAIALTWVYFGLPVIHFTNLPRTIATALLEDDE